MRGKVVLVCGGRDYKDYGQMNRVLTQVNPDMIIHGNAQGADKMAGRWAKSQNVHCAVVDALWDAHQRVAGPIRNATMLWLMPDVVVAFPGGDGTADMVKKAKKAGVQVIEVEKRDDSEDRRAG